MSYFVDKKILLTGASAGIGASTARLLAQRGAKLYLTARRLDRLEEIRAECLSLGSPLVEVAAHDLSIEGQGKIIVKECLALLGGLDILICNAGFGVFGPIEENSPDIMRRLWQVNIQSAYESIFESVQHFQKYREGHIVLTSSVLGKKGMPYASGYCATKFAQVGLGEALWGELSDQGISVTVICPGSTSSEFHAVATRSQGTPNPMKDFRQQPARLVAEALIRAIENRKREVHLTLGVRLLLALDRISPALSTSIMAWIGRSQLGSR